jgi:hypothetical protein
LAEKLGFEEAKPYYQDGSPPNAQVLSFVKPAKE